MECDALFAESDDEVVVLPTLPTMDTTVSLENGQTPKPVSSNYVNSTTPTRPYEVNVAPISHPSQSRTPVPEEYQPLPDSSSSFDYSIGPANPDSSNGDIRSNPINIRYQPKPQWPKNYCFPPSMRWEHHPQRDPMYFNNYLLLGNYNSPYNPVSYAMDPALPRHTPASQTDNEPQRETDPPPNNASSNENVTVDVPDLASWLERPSRQLNISPGRRQSRESESNPIELSSEEEDNTPRKRPCDNGAGNDISPTNLSRNAHASNSTREQAQVVVKGEPHDLSVATANVDAIETHLRRFCDRGPQEETPLPLTTRRPSANQQPVQDPSAPTMGEIPVPDNPSSFVRIKLETREFRCGQHRILGHVQTDQCDRHSPRLNNASRIYPGDRHHHHHHHNHNHSHHHHHHNHNHNHGILIRGYQPCAVDHSNSTSSIPVQVKTEPRSELMNERPIKQEPNEEDATAQQVSPTQPIATLATPSLPGNYSWHTTEPAQEQIQVKAEPPSSSHIMEPVLVERVQIKVEPQNPSHTEASENITVKIEASDLSRSRDVDAGGDRSAACPQPGPSAGFVPVQPKVESASTQQVNAFQMIMSPL